MSLLGKYRKQPVEVEIYGIQFAEDMTSTDEITSFWQSISRKSSVAWDQVVISTPYTATVADADKTLVCIASITLPVDASDGFRLNVANQSQDSSITVGSVTVPARGAVVVLRKDAAWVVEAKTNALLISAPQDQRVRTTVYGGVVNQVYKVQVAVTTAEGRVMQDEFLVSIKED